MDDLFDNVYFDDYREFYHEKRLHFRLNKANIIRLRGFFDELERQNCNKTSYLRNLFNEYANMKKDKREEICFDAEESLLRHAINEKIAITCTYENKNFYLIPYELDLNYIDGSLYLIAVETHDPSICHAFRLCKLRNIILKQNESFSFAEELIEKLEYVIVEYDYTERSTIKLNRLKCRQKK